MKVTLTDGSTVECEPEPMGGGAAGTAYFTRDGRSVVKLFTDPTPDMAEILEEVIVTYNCVRGDCYFQGLMSWPDAIVSQPCLGIRMPCAPRDMNKMTWIILPKLYNRLPPEKKNWSNRLLMAIRLARAVARLHGSGLAHSDLSPNNIMVNPEKGTVNLIDLDGLVVPGFLPPQVLGTPGYIAPETLAGTAPPSTATDRHALAVLLYQLLLFRHPLRGPKKYADDPDEDERLAMGGTAVFVDHPSDRSNRPKSGFWPTQLLGESLSKLFLRSFVQGLSDPTVRPTAGEWETALVRLSDRVVGCVGHECHEKYFPVAEGRAVTCPWCNTPFAVGAGVPVLRLYANLGQGQFQPEPDWWIAGYPGRTLHAWHCHRGVEPKPNADLTVKGQIAMENGKWFLVNRDLPEARLIENGTVGRPVAVNDRIELTDGLTMLMAPPPKGRMVYVQWIR